MVVLFPPGGTPPESGASYPFAPAPANTFPGLHPIPSGGKSVPRPLFTMTLDLSDFPPSAGHRFFVSPALWPPGAAALTLVGQESRHCAEVLRHRAGDRITTFDGRGRVATCEVTHISKREVALSLVSERLFPRPMCSLVLAQAVAKAKAMDWLIQKATEIGASHIFPLTTARTVVRIPAEEAFHHREKWERIALETAKQCTRAWLPEIADPQPLASFLASPHDAQLRLVAALAPAVQTIRSAIGLSPVKPTSAMVLIGPEGDFSPVELTAAQAAGFVPISLGPHILRSETAALVSLSVLAYELGSPM